MAKLLVGEKMPNFVVDTVWEKGITIASIVGGKPTMFMVLRYIGCTICRYDVHMLTEKYQQFVDKGVTVVIVMQSTPENVVRDLAGQRLPFHLICDVKQEIYKTLAIEAAADIPALLGDSLPIFEAKCADAGKFGYKHGEYEGVEEQFPAFFYVDGDLTVKEAHYAKTIMDMPSIEEMLGKI